MLIEYNFINPLKKSKLDKHLAQGWFRCADFLVRGQLICLDKRFSPVVHIRLPLKEYRQRKSQRRIVRRVEESFEVRIEEAHITEEKELLYSEFRSRFHGFVCFSLNDLFGITAQSNFDTREIGVYDGGRLVALSFFDLGKKSMASLISIYDAGYRMYGLGTYTMLKEIEFGAAHAFDYYYPGHILLDNPCYDYKLAIGDVQYLCDDKWGRTGRAGIPAGVVEVIRGKTQQIEDDLSRRKIPYIRKINPFYAYGYISHFHDRLIKSTMPVFIQHRIGPERFLLEYDPDSGEFALSVVVRTDAYNYLVESLDCSYYEHDDIYLHELYIHRHTLATSPTVRTLVDDYLLPMVG